MFTLCTAQPAAVEVEKANATAASVGCLTGSTCCLACGGDAVGASAWATRSGALSARSEISVAVSEWSLYGDSHTLATLHVFREKPSTLATVKAWFRSLIQPCQAGQRDLEELALTEATPSALESALTSPPKSALKGCLKKREDVDAVYADSPPKSTLKSCLKKREDIDTVDAGSAPKSALKSCLKKREDADTFDAGSLGVSKSAPEKKADPDTGKTEVASKKATPVKKNIKGPNFDDEEASTSSGETSEGLRSLRSSDE